LGQLEEGCRLPELIAAAGAVLREVGATNRTRVEDYAEAVGNETAALLMVSPADYAIVGSTADVTLEELVALGRRRKLPVIRVLAVAGLLDADAPGGPLPGECLRAGAELVVLGGDKLLGGPQCGIVLGRSESIEALARRPLAGPLRIGKLPLAALAATLRLYGDEETARRDAPLLRLLDTSTENLENRAQRLAPQLAAAAVVDEAEPTATTTSLTGHALPQRGLPSWCIRLKPSGISATRLAAMLRQGAPPVIARVEDDRLVLDLRTVLPRQDMQLAAVFEALEGGRE
jgi:L-seryl-tRNA(Ser) seleniumtransferase